MTGRGRGRGRGRGSSSIDFHQLGFGNGEPLPAPVLQPPPTFPPLEFKPIPLKQGPEGEYMVALKRDLVEYLRYINSQKQNNEYSSASGIERFSDKYQTANSSSAYSWESQFHWDRLPLELHPVSKRLSTKRKVLKGDKSVNNKKSATDISCKLDELAKLEEKDEESDEPKETEEKEQGDENEEEVPGDEDDDDEMDDGTDYLNNYFDNGESYFEDEDDKLDDGPVY